MTPDDWELNPTLAADCHQLGKLDDVLVLLHRNAALHWFILVPQCAELDLLDLPPRRRDVLLTAAQKVSTYLKAELAYPRVNVGALGLVVPQLHLHVIGRREADACWPAPVWGNLNAQATYEDVAITAIERSLGTRPASA